MGDALAVALLERRVADVMTRQPKCIGRGELAAKADGGGRPEGVIHLHDLLRARVV